MKLSIKHYGQSWSRPSSIIELTVSSEGTTLVEDISSMDGSIDEVFIQDLKDIVNELEEQNEKIKQIKKC